MRKPNSKGADDAKRKAEADAKAKQKAADDAKRKAEAEAEAKAASAQKHKKKQLKRKLKKVASSARRDFEQKFDALGTFQLAVVVKQLVFASLSRFGKR